MAMPTMTPTAPSFLLIISVPDCCCCMFNRRRHLGGGLWDELLMRQN